MTPEERATWLANDINEGFFVGLSETGLVALASVLHVQFIQVAVASSPAQGWRLLSDDVQVDLGDGDMPSVGAIKELVKAARVVANHENEYPDEMEEDEDEFILCPDEDDKHRITLGMLRRLSAALALVSPTRRRIAAPTPPALPDDVRDVVDAMADAGIALHNAIDADDSISGFDSLLNDWRIAFTEYQRKIDALRPADKEMT